MTTTCPCPHCGQKIECDTPPVLVVCSCLHCGQPLEFEAENAGSIVACPKCGKNVELSLEPPTHPTISELPGEKTFVRTTRTNELQCLKCKSGNVFAGKLGRPISIGWGTAIFKPAIKVPFLAPILGAGPTCDDEAFACLDCGLVWSSLSAQDLNNFIAKCGGKPKPEA
jgi:DNA-directed RNA polymerase subunit RPC12/RpoP